MTSDLNNLLIKDKFSKDVWLERGLSPSSKSLCNSLQQELNLVISELLKLPSKATGQIKTSVLENSLSNFDKYNLDSEEMELVADYFNEIAELIEVNMNKALDIWLYGFYSHEIINPKPIEILRTISKNCLKCQIALSIDIVKERNNVPALWEIVQCNNCNEFNFLSIPANVDRFRNGNFFVFETLKQNDYKLDRVIEKMEFYRKANSD